MKLLFWLGFLVGGSWLQQLLPGMDVLAPGLLLAMQREPWPVAVALAALFIAVQEGAGSLDFGAGVLIYGVLAGGFLLGAGVFDARSVAFSALLGLVHALAVVLAASILAGLQQFTLDAADLPLRVAVQCGVFVVVWLAAGGLHPGRTDG